MLLRLIEDYDRMVSERIKFLEEENDALRKENAELLSDYLKAVNNGSNNMLRSALAAVATTSKDPETVKSCTDLFGAVPVGN